MMRFTHIDVEAYMLKTQQSNAKNTLLLLTKKLLKESQVQ